jgi:hypothetical protein
LKKISLTQNSIIPINGGTPTEIKETKDRKRQNISPDGKYLVYNEVKISNILGKDFYPDLEKSVQIYDGLDYRHWDTWNEGSTTFFTENTEDAVGTDIMGKENFDSPQSLLAEMKITSGHRQ